MSVVKGDPWTVTHWQEPDALVVHIFPSRGRKHTLDASCWCLPSVEDRTNELGGRVISFDHHREN